LISVPTSRDPKKEYYASIEKMLTKCARQIDEMRPETIKSHLKGVLKLRETCSRNPKLSLERKYDARSVSTSLIIERLKEVTPDLNVKGNSEHQSFLDIESATNHKELHYAYQKHHVFAWLSESNRSVGDIEAVMCNFDPNFTKSDWKDKGISHLVELIDTKDAREVEDLNRLFEFLEKEHAAVKHPKTKETPLGLTLPNAKKKKFDQDQEEL
jgi:hypothetical protein